MPKHGTNTFKDEWLQDECFKDWLVNESTVSEKCKWCGISFDIRNMS